MALGYTNRHRIISVGSLAVLGSRGSRTHCLESQNCFRTLVNFSRLASSRLVLFGTKIMFRLLIILLLPPAAAGLLVLRLGRASSSWLASSWLPILILSPRPQCRPPPPGPSPSLSSPAGIIISLLADRYSRCNRRAASQEHHLEAMVWEQRRRRWGPGQLESPRSVLCARSSAPSTAWVGNQGHLGGVRALPVGDGSLCSISSPPRSNEKLLVSGSAVLTENYRPSRNGWKRSHHNLPDIPGLTVTSTCAIPTSRSSLLLLNSSQAGCSARHMGTTARKLNHPLLWTSLQLSSVILVSFPSTVAKPDKVPEK